MNHGLYQSEHSIKENKARDARIKEETEKNWQAHIKREYDEKYPGDDKWFYIFKQGCESGRKFR